MSKSEIDKRSLFVGEDVTIQGHVSTAGRIEVHGLITGDVQASEIQIGAGGRVEGSIQASKLDVSGFAGDVVTVSDRLLVRSTGHLEGQITYDSIQIDAGANVFGTLKRHGQDDMPEQSKEISQSFVSDIEIDGES